jgi:hypothetical protein
LAEKPRTIESERPAERTYTADVLGAADLHLHTRASDGLVAARDLVDFVELGTDLDVIAITDHDEISACLDGREWAARQGFRIEVVPGVEVTTLDGHLLALFVEERPPALRSLQFTAEWVRFRGGLCVAPHPFTRWTHSLNRRALSEAIAADLIAGVEVFNASLAGRASRPHALRVARQHGHPRRRTLCHTRGDGRRGNSAACALDGPPTIAAHRSLRAVATHPEDAKSLGRAHPCAKIRST